MNDRPGIMEILKKGFSNAKADLKEAGAKLSKDTLDAAIGTNLVQEKGAEYVSDTIKKTVNDIKENAGSLIKEASGKIAGESNIDLYTRIRNNLKTPNEPIFTKIFRNVIARVMSSAAGIGGWIGATFVNLAFNPSGDQKVNPADVSNIFGSFMTKIIGRKPSGQPA